MTTRLLLLSQRISQLIAGLALAAAAFAAAAQSSPADNGVVRVKSAYSFDDTTARLKRDIAAKGIQFFSEIDQSALGARAGVTLRRSTLLVFGNPPLGTQFITANPDAGLDWPVRLLVTQDADGSVWAA